MPGWRVIGAYRNIPLPIRPIPPHMNPTERPDYLSKPVPVILESLKDASSNGGVNGGSR